MREIKFRGKIEGQWWYSDPDNDNWQQFWVLVDRKTLGQYINYDDKNKRNIYEGDILSRPCQSGEHKSHNFEVKPLPEFDEEFDPSSNGWSFEEDTEVVGNVYDNPKLLEI